MRRARSALAFLAMATLTAGLAAAGATATGAATPSLPAPFSAVQPLVTADRGASPSTETPLAPDAVQVTDAKGTYTLSESAFKPKAVLLHLADGPHLTTWVVNSATGKVYDGPISVGGKAEQVATPGAPAGLFVGCYLYVYAPFTFTYIIEWDDGYSEIAACFPSTGFNMILSQQLWQADSTNKWYPVGPNDVTGAPNTGFWDHNVDAMCYSGGGPWWSWQHASALLEFGGNYGTAGYNSPGAWLHCNAV